MVVGAWPTGRTAHGALFIEPIASVQERAMRRLAMLLLFTLLARPVLAQSEEALRAAFEGKMVRVKIEMPGAAQGVDIHPGTPNPIDFSQHTTRLKRFGTAYHPGDIAQ